jgi:plasmid stability protein
MASVTISNLEEGMISRLRIRAAEHGRSMEEEARAILTRALDDKKKKPTVGLATAIRRRFAPVGYVDLPQIERGPMRPPVEFDSSTRNTIKITN